MPEVNTDSGLLSLPVEVYELVHKELLLGCRFITREDVLANARQLDSCEFQYRADVLRPLMHSCRALRAAYISAYYEHVEVCIVRVGQVWYKHLAERLERAAKVLMDPEMQEVAAQVRYVRSAVDPRMHRY